MIWGIPIFGNLFEAGYLLGISIPFIKGSWRGGETPIGSPQALASDLPHLSHPRNARREAGQQGRGTSPMAQQLRALSFLANRKGTNSLLILVYTLQESNTSNGNGGKLLDGKRS